MQIQGDGRVKIEAALGRPVTLLWTGNPAQGLRFRAADLGLVPFSFLWFGFAIFWEYSAVSGGTPLFFRLWGVPFLLVGLYISLGRFFVDAYIRAHTTYGVTSNEAFIVRDGAFPSVTTYNLRGMGPVEMRQGPNGTGSLIFGPRPMYGWRAWQASTTDFIGIADVARVYRLVTGQTA